MEHTAGFAQRIDLKAMAPRPELVSTGYALVNPGVEYLVSCRMNRTARVVPAVRAV